LNVQIYDEKESCIIVARHLLGSPP